MEGTDRLTWLAILLAAGALFYSMSRGGGLPLFWNPPSLGIVLGGTAAALFVQYSLSQVRSVVRAVMDTYFTRPPDVTALIEFFAALAEKVKAQTVLVVEEDARRTRDRFLRHGLQALADYLPREELVELLERELASLIDRNRLAHGFFKSASVVAPGFGMLGTLIGLIQMLSRLDDPTQVGPGLAVALVTTFYGALLANLVALPISGKVRLRGEEEAKVKTMMMDGILLLESGATPSQVRDVLRTHLSPFMRRASAAPEDREEARAAPGRVDARG